MEYWFRTCPSICPEPWYTAVPGEPMSNRWMSVLSAAVPVVGVVPGGSPAAYRVVAMYRRALLA